VPNCSACRKRNSVGTLTSGLPVFELPFVLVRLDHVASLIVTLLVYTQQLKNDMKQAQWRVPSYASNAQR
jgi:hypothetical protein